MLAEKLTNRLEELKPRLPKKDKSYSNTTLKYKLVGDFRNEDLSGWKSDGLAFGNRTTLGEPVFNASGNLIRLDNGRASSKRIGKGIFGALRSPNIVLNDDFIGIRARGNKSTLRIVIDNFQKLLNS